MGLTVRNCLDISMSSTGGEFIQVTTYDLLAGIAEFYSQI